MGVDGSACSVVPGNTFDVTGKADLAVGLTARPGLLNTPIDYTQTATNSGPVALTTGTVTTPLPSQTVSVSDLPGNCTYDRTAPTGLIITCRPITAGTMPSRPPAWRMAGRRRLRRRP